MFLSCHRHIIHSFIRASLRSHLVDSITVLVFGFVSCLCICPWFSYRWIFGDFLCHFCLTAAFLNVILYFSLFGLVFVIFVLVISGFLVCLYFFGFSNFCSCWFLHFLVLPWYVFLCILCLFDFFGYLWIFVVSLFYICVFVAVFYFSFLSFLHILGFFFACSGYIYHKFRTISRDFFSSTFNPAAYTMTWFI